MKEPIHPTIDQFCIETVLSALGDPIRLRIIRSLSHREETTCSCCNIDLPKSALSHHFKVLREAGLIRVRIEGKQRFLSIRYEELENRFPGLLTSVIENIEK
jgi:DNA-binding transcriptional ArsR family regulator